jgi:hypothetical protein
MALDAPMEYAKYEDCEACLSVTNGLITITAETPSRHFDADGPVYLHKIKCTQRNIIQRLLDADQAFSDGVAARSYYTFKNGQEQQTPHHPKVFEATKRGRALSVVLPFGKVRAFGNDAYCAMVGMFSSGWELSTLEAPATSKFVIIVQPEALPALNLPALSPLTAAAAAVASVKLDGQLAQRGEASLAMPPVTSSSSAAAAAGAGSVETPNGRTALLTLTPATAVAAATVVVREPAAALAVELEVSGEGTSAALPPSDTAVAAAETEAEAAPAGEALSSKRKRGTESVSLCAISILLAYCALLHLYNHFRVLQTIIAVHC